MSGVCLLLAIGFARVVPADAQADAKESGVLDVLCVAGVLALGAIVALVGRAVERL